MFWSLTATTGKNRRLSQTHALFLRIGIGWLEAQQVHNQLPNYYDRIVAHFISLSCKLFAANQLATSN